MKFHTKPSEEPIDRCIEVSANCVGSQHTQKTSIVVSFHRPRSGYIRDGIHHSIESIKKSEIRNVVQYIHVAKLRK
jgi:hypothetical protein